MLTTLIHDVVVHSGFRLDDLDAIAVAKGPGSYTGLRIAVSTAKGLCFALEKPLIGINTLQAMTAQITDFYDDGYLFCPMLDARRMEVFCAVYDRNLHEIEPTQAKIMDKDSFSELLKNNPVVFFGDGAAKCAALFEGYNNALFLKNPTYPSAKSVGRLATLRFESGVFEDLETFEPYYLKDFVGTVPKKV